MVVVYQINPGYYVQVDPLHEFYLFHTTQYGIHFYLMPKLFCMAFDFTPIWIGQEITHWNLRQSYSLVYFETKNSEITENTLQLSTMVGEAFGKWIRTIRTNTAWVLVRKSEKILRLLPKMYFVLIEKWKKIDKAHKLLNWFKNHQLIVGMSSRWLNNTKT